MDNKKNGIPKLRFPGFTGAWEQRKLGDFIIEFHEKTTVNDQYPILTSSRKGIFLQTDYYSGNQIASKDNTGYNIVPFGYFTYRHMSDDNIFRFNINKIVDKGIVSTLYPVFTTNKYLDSRYLQIQLNHGNEFAKYALLQKQGGSRTYMYLSKLKKLVLTMPKSTSEQKTISNFFDTLDSLITLHQRKLEHLQEQKKGLLQKMFPKNGETVPEVRFPGFTDAWEQRKLGEIVEWSKGSGLSKDALNIQGIGVPVIHYADLYKFNSVQKEVIHWTMNNIGTKIPENNLLFPMSDVTPDGLARTSTVLQSNVKAGGDVLIAKLNKDILSTFMSYQINRNKNQILPLVTGTTVRHINSKSLSTLKVTVPGKNEQKYVGSILMRFDSLIALHQRKLEHLELMKKGLLQQMFV